MRGRLGPLSFWRSPPVQEIRQCPATPNLCWLAMRRRGARRNAAAPSILPKFRAPQWRLAGLYAIDNAGALWYLSPRSPAPPTRFAVPAEEGLFYSER